MPKPPKNPFHFFSRRPDRNGMRLFALFPRFCSFSLFALFSFPLLPIVHFFSFFLFALLQISRAFFFIASSSLSHSFFSFLLLDENLLGRWSDLWLIPIINQEIDFHIRIKAMVTSRLSQLEFMVQLPAWWRNNERKLRQSEKSLTTEHEDYIWQLLCLIWKP